jgi:archaellum biogenesis ATPase FlaH
MNQHFRLDDPLVLVIDERQWDECRVAGLPHVRHASTPQDLLNSDGTLRDELQWFSSFVILIPEGGEALRDTIAVNIGDERCKWAYWPYDPADIPAAVANASRMWTDEIARMSDIPDPGPVKTYTTGLKGLDDHGLRLVLPAFMPIVGPYASGKSVLLRQLLVNLWRLHGWKFLLTSFEEQVKPRYQRDLRHALIGKPLGDWEPRDIVTADVEIERMCVFMRRKRNTVLDLDRLLDRIEFAVRVYGLKVVAIDPVNEIEHVVPKGMTKTDYIGHFIMRLKALADDYNLLMICALHPPKDGVEKRLQKNGLLTLNDGADSAHWANKADVGWCVWRDLVGPTMLHVDKVKDHTLMGKPTLCELHLDTELNQFRVGRIGYDVLADDEVEEWAGKTRGNTSAGR